MKQFDVLKTEALLFGVGGLLENKKGDDYYISLKNEYEFLKAKYRLTVPKIQLYFLRMHPASFPTLKLSQLAVLLSKRKNVLSQIIYYNNIAEVINVFKSKASTYWDTHYVFNRAGKFSQKISGKSLLESVVINSVVPILYTYGNYYGFDHLKIRAIDFLGAIQKESNSIVKQFQKIGMQVVTSQDSQSLLQLKKEYCDVNRCLDCAIGYSILKRRPFADNQAC